MFKETASGTLGAFTLPVSGLVQGMGYSVKAFATNSEGTTYSGVFVFYTDTTVIWNNGTAFFTHDLVRGGRQRYLLTLDERRIVSFTSEGGSQLRADLRNGSGSVLATFTGDTDVDLEKLLPAGAYVLEVYRTVGSVPSEGYNLTIDASVVPETRPDVTVGTTAAAPVGAESYTPASQSVSLTSLKAGPVTAYATISNHGNFPDIQSVRASGGDAFFTVSYFGPEGNLTTSLLTGGYRTPGLESGDEAIPIRVSITPNKKKLTKKKGRTKRILKKTLILNLAATSSFDPAIRDEGSIIVQTR